MHGDERAKICKEIAELVNQMTDAQAVSSRMGRVD